MAILSAAGALKIAASSAVIVVPIFAPTINGYTCFRFTLEVATNGTIIDVLIELDCQEAVRNNPHPNDLIGLLKTNESNLLRTGTKKLL